MGVALATSITRFLEVIACAFDSQVNRIIRFRVKDLFIRGGQLLRDFMHYSVPSAINDMAWGLAFSVYSVILGHLSGENNTPSLARRVSEERMQREGVRLGVDLFLDVARRDQVGSVYTLEVDV
jgi:hypothetical protein